MIKKFTVKQLITNVYLIWKPVSRLSWLGFYMYFGWTFGFLVFSRSITWEIGLKWVKKFSGILVSIVWALPWNRLITNILKHYCPVFPFYLYPLKTLENQKFSDAFKGLKKVTPTIKSLISSIKICFFFKFAHLNSCLNVQPGINLNLLSIS